MLCWAFCMFGRRQKQVYLSTCLLSAAASGRTECRAAACRTHFARRTSYRWKRWTSLLSGEFTGRIETHFASLWTLNEKNKTKKTSRIFQAPEKTNWHWRMRERMTWMDRLYRLSWGGVCTVTFFDWTVRPVSVFHLHFKPPLSHVWDSVQFQTCKGRLRKNVLT